MLRTGMPKTPVDEHSHPRGGERQIRTSWQLWMIDSEPKAATVEFPPN
jgi:hypothetical protein